MAYYSRPYRDAVKIQQLMLGDAEKPDTKPLHRAALARAYADLEEMKRKIRMKPLSKAVDVIKLKKYRQRQGPAFEEPTA